MQKIFTWIAASLACAASAFGFAGERQVSENEAELKPGQCVAASFVYEQGELLDMSGGITKVCTKVNGRSVWLAVDRQELKALSY